MSRCSFSALSRLAASVAATSRSLRRVAFSSSSLKSPSLIAAKIRELGYSYRQAGSGSIFSPPTALFRKKLSVDELQQQTTDCLGLFLLNPMPGPIDEMRAPPLRTSRGLHPLKSARKLIDAPIAFARDETRRHIEGAAGKRFKLTDVLVGKASIPLQAALKSGSSKLGRIDRQLCVREPSACRNFLLRRHMLGRGLRHPLGEIHDVIGRHLRQLAGRERAQLERLVPRPIGALVMIIGAQKRVDALRSSPHIIVRFARLVIALVMLPWRVKPRHVLENA